MNPIHAGNTPPRRIWFLLAHRSGARIFRATSDTTLIELVQELDFPDGRRQNREIDTDAKGSRYSASAGRTSRGAGFAPGSQTKHGLDPHLEATEHVADIFAKSLAERLRIGRTNQQFDELVLIAEPGFLGKLRAFLDKETSKHVIQTLNRNWAEMPKNDLFENLRQIRADTRHVA